jgi:hypothetical protein
MLLSKESIETAIVILEPKKFVNLREKMDTEKFLQRTSYLWLHILISMEMAN